MYQMQQTKKDTVYIMERKIRKAGIALMMVMLMAALCACGGGGAGEGSAQPGAEGSSSGEPASPGTLAANVGEWVKISKKAEADNKDHNAKVRITKVILDEEKAKEMIGEYNSSGVSETVSDDTGNEKVQFAAAEYEVVFGKDFPEAEFGITDVTVPFEIVGEDGEEKISYEGTGYEGLTKTEQIGSVPQGYDFYLPDHYKGKIAFLIPKGCENFLFRTEARDGSYAYINPVEEAR